ncbi:arginase family protein [Micromonospora chalcea]
MMRRIAVLDAPTNLGLRPPTASSVPGCAKAPGALRDHGLLARLRARDAGCLTPPRYDPGDWRPGDGVCHAPEISAYSMALADRIGAIIDRGEFPLVLGGDCSVLLGSGLAMHRLGEAVGGRIGLVFVDGHSDFRHPGNASYVGAAAGEDLALVTGRGQPDLAAIEGRRPYFRDIDVVVLGIRAQDEYRLDLQAAGITTRPVPALRAEGAARTAQWAHEQLVDCAGYWVHIDVDVLDPAVMPAVDAPDPGGIAFAELEILLAGLVDTPHCLGVELTVFDPDYDPDGAYAAEIVNTVVAGLAPVVAPGAVPPRLLPPGPPPQRARYAEATRAGSFLSPNGDAAERDADPAAGTAGLGSGLAADEPDLASAPTSGGLASASLETPVPAVAVEPIGPAAAVSSGLLRRVPQTDEDAPKDTPPSSAGID